MPSCPATLDLLGRRRSVPAVALIEPGPSGAELDLLLTLASRVPDHGKLAPWRFIVLAGEAQERYAERLTALFLLDRPDAGADQIAKERDRFACPVTVAVVSRAGPHPKIPEWEQTLAAGAVSMTLLVAAHAMGFAGNWLTGWPAYDRSALDLLGVGPDEKVAGFIHLGTPRLVPPDRPRPALPEIVTRWGEA